MEELLNGGELLVGGKLLTEDGELPRTEGREGEPWNQDEGEAM